MENFEVEKEVEKHDFRNVEDSQKNEELERIQAMVKGAFNNFGMERKTHIEKILFKIYEDKINNEEVIYEDDVKSYIRKFRNEMNKVLVTASEYDAAYVIDHVINKLENDGIKDENEILDRFELYTVDSVKEFLEENPEYEMMSDEERRNRKVSVGSSTLTNVAVAGTLAYSSKYYMDKASQRIDKAYSKETQEVIDGVYEEAQTGNKDATFTAKEVEKLTRTLTHNKELIKDSLDYRAGLARVMRLVAVGTDQSNVLAVNVIKENYGSMLPGLIKTNETGTEIIDIQLLEREMQRTNKVNGIEDSIYNDYDKVKAHVVTKKEKVKPIEPKTDLKTKMAKSMERADRTQNLMTLRYGQNSKNPAKKQKYMELLEQLRDYPELAKYLREDIIQMAQSPSVSQDEKQALYEIVLTIDSIGKNRDKSEELGKEVEDDVVADVLEENTTSRDTNNIGPDVSVEDFER